MFLWPKEHGAYGQISFPLVTAFAVAGVSQAGLLLAGTVIAGFLAHEPAAVLLGLRGPRAKRERHEAAIRCFGFCLASGIATGLGAFAIMGPAARWWLAVPLAPAILQAVATARGHEKSWHGEVSAAAALSGAAVPVSIAAGAPTSTAMAVAIPFVLLFVASTLAVRVVILRARRGGDPRATKVTRRAALSLAVGATAALVLVTAAGLLSPAVLGASAPGLLTAAIVAARPPKPTHLRTIGWTLVAVSVMTAAIVVATA